MPSTRQGSTSSSNAKRPARKSASLKINYADDSPKKVSKVEPLDIKRNLGDAWSSMVKGCKVDLAKKKKPSSTPAAAFVIGNKKTTTVKMINPEIVTLDDGDGKLKSKTPTYKNSILPKHLIITKISDVGAKQANIKEKVDVALPKQGNNMSQKPLAPKPKNSVSIKKVEGLLGITIQKSVEDIPEVGNKAKNEPCMDNKIVDNDAPKRFEKENIELRTSLRNVSTPIRKKNLESPTLTRSSGRILKKPSIINSQKKAIVKTIKKLNQDQKKRIEERLGDIGPNLQKIKPKEEVEEQAKEIAPESVVERKPLKEVLSDANWLTMFLQTEPTARYNPVDDTLFCFTCKDMIEDGCNDGWVEGHPKGVEWLKYREHKLGEEHQKTSTKYFLQLYTAHAKYV